MDREQLKKELTVFVNECGRRGRAITGMCLAEAFPGVANSSFIVEVKAPWVDGTDCSDAIDFLFDVLFETTSEEVRKNIFSIQVLDSNQKLHCVSPPYETDEDIFMPKMLSEEAL